MGKNFPGPIKLKFRGQTGDINEMLILPKHYITISQVIQLITASGNRKENPIEISPPTKAVNSTRAGVESLLSKLRPQCCWLYAPAHGLVLRSSCFEDNFTAEIAEYIYEDLPPHPQDCASAQREQNLHRHRFRLTPINHDFIAQLIHNTEPQNPENVKF